MGLFIYIYLGLATFGIYWVYILCSIYIFLLYTIHSQVLDMTEKELEYLAKHLGHDVKTHKEYYRLQNHTIELTKVL